MQPIILLSFQVRIKLHDKKKKSLENNRFDTWRVAAVLLWLTVSFYFIEVFKKTQRLMNGMGGGVYFK